LAIRKLDPASAKKITVALRASKDVVMGARSLGNLRVRGVVSIACEPTMNFIVQ
jgi:hypothetical protein